MKHLIGLALGESNGCSVEEGFPLLKKYGFDATFTGVAPDETLDLWASTAAKLGIAYSSLHAPFDRSWLLWEDVADGDDALRELTDSVDTCARFDVPILVVHPYIGFQEHEPNALGLARFRRLAEYADRRGVKIAIENVENEAHLDCLLQGLCDCPSVGFCLDSGHELCYNRGRDLLADYGDRLIYTHINSNVGVTSPDGMITWRDDAHMLPFDGKVDMAHLAARLKKCNYNGILMMELLKANRSRRNTNDIYASLTAEEYIAEAASRIKRLRDMVD